MLSNETSNENA